MVDKRIDTPSSLIRAEQVEGTPVYNTKAEKLGTIDDLVIDKVSGKTLYAIMSFGGFLGMGEKQPPLPWGALDYDTELEGYVVDLDKDRLEKWAKEVGWEVLLNRAGPTFRKLPDKDKANPRLADQSEDKLPTYEP